MARRSFSDVPNRIVRIFLEEAGRQYDLNRGRNPFRAIDADLRSRFLGGCAYCGCEPPHVEEHVVPINRQAAGLHAWGNIVPACRDCNRIKAGDPWHLHPRLDEERRQRISRYIDDFEYQPDVTELREVLEKLYTLADGQTRALIDFGLVAARPYIAGLHTD